MAVSTAAAGPAAVIVAAMTTVTVATMIAIGVVLMIVTVVAMTIAAVISVATGRGPGVESAATRGAGMSRTLLRERAATKHTHIVPMLP